RAGTNDLNAEHLLPCYRPALFPRVISGPFKATSKPNRSILPLRVDKLGRPRSTSFNLKLKHLVRQQIQPNRKGLAEKLHDRRDAFGDCRAIKVREDVGVVAALGRARDHGIEDDAADG